MRRAALLIALLALPSLAFAPAPLPKPERRAQPAAPSMEGLWRQEGERDTVRITAATWNSFPEICSRPDFSLKIDPRASPAAFDMTWNGPGYLHFRGIYKVEGDTLTICYNRANNARANNGRPTAFDGPGKGEHTEVYRRVR